MGRLLPRAAATAPPVSGFGCAKRRAIRMRSLSGSFSSPPKAYAYHGGTEARRTATEVNSCHELVSVTSRRGECGS